MVCQCCACDDYVCCVVGAKGKGFCVCTDLVLEGGRVAVERAALLFLWGVLSQIVVLLEGVVVL